MLPVLRRLYPDRQELAQAAKRHLEYFNTHPYLAGVILGCAARVEEKTAQGGGASAAEVTAVKMGMMGPLAALGDSFFWATLRPLAALLGVLIVFFAQGDSWAPWGVAVFLLVFNLPHLLLRGLGVSFGYAAGDAIVPLLRKVDMPALVHRMQAAGLVLLGTLLAGLQGFHVSRGEGPTGGLVVAAFGLLAFLLVRRKVRISHILWGALFCSILASYIHPLPFWGRP
jgi:mannose/fructose/N-acetylgalactosamine-specific phosphotransferase system component IID